MKYRTSSFKTDNCVLNSLTFEVSTFVTIPKKKYSIYSLGVPMDYYFASMIASVIDKPYTSRLAESILYDFTVFCGIYFVDIGRNMFRRQWNSFGHVD